MVDCLSHVVSIPSKYIVCVVRLEVGICSQEMEDEMNNISYRWEDDKNRYRLTHFTMIVFHLADNIVDIKHKILSGCQ